MKAVFVVRLKPGVLDPQGRAVAEALRGLGFDEVGDARVSRRIELELAETDPERARARAAEMARRLLANPVMESWSVEIV